MTPISTDRPAPRDPAPRAAPRPYARPSLTPLGTIASSTAGPDGERTLDMLVGDVGGFRMDPDPTS